MIAPICPRDGCHHPSYAHTGPDEPPGCRTPGCRCPYSAYAVVKYAHDHQKTGDPPP